MLAPAGDAANHPILAGVAIPAEGFVVRSWLYHVEPLPGDCTVLLWGEAVGSERGDAPARQPILWTRELPRAAGLPPQRIAYASLGHPEDFARPEIRAIAAQMVAWALSREREIDDAERAAIRESPFSAPPTR